QVPRLAEEARHSLPRGSGRSARGSLLERRRPPREADHRGGDRRPPPASRALRHLLMPRFLHLIKQDSPPLAAAIVARQLQASGAEVIVVPLGGAAPPLPAGVAVPGLR